MSLQEYNALFAEINMRIAHCQPLASFWPPQGLGDDDEPLPYDDECPFDEEDDEEDESDDESDEDYEDYLPHE